MVVSLTVLSKGKIGRNCRRGTGSQISKGWQQAAWNEKKELKTGCYQSSLIKRLSVAVIASNAPPKGVFLGLVAYAITKLIHSDFFTGLLF